jgi:HEAT repeat protein
LNQALGELAKAGINSKARFRLGEDLACDVMGEPLFDLACRLGWLNLVDRDANTDEAVYAFFHPTFQEYFAACAIDDWDYFLPRAHDNHNPKPVSERYRIFEPQWKEVILLWLGRQQEELREPKEEFIQTLIEFEDGCSRFYWYRAYFLGAVGISECNDCSKAYEIVSQIVKWGFGYFNIEKQGWQTFLDPIAEGARAAIPETNRTKAITALVELISHCQNKYTRNQAAKSLRHIDPENLTAIATLEELINGSHDILKEIIHSLHSEDICQEEEQNVKICGSGKSNEIEKLTKIATLVERISNCQDEFTRWQAADNLLTINSDNPNAIAALVELINNYPNETILWSAVHSLGKVSSGHPVAIVTLVELINNSQDSNTCKLATISLGKVCLGNSTGIATLVKLIVNSQEQDIRRLAAYNLKGILLESQIEGVVTVLKNYLSDETYENDSRRYRDCYSVIWHCAQNLPYPDFYQAWHQTTIHETG